MLTMTNKRAPRTTKLARQITDLRDRLGLSQAEFGAKVYVGWRTVSNWERSIKIPSEAQLELIRLKLGKL